VHAHDHISIGASTATFGALGVNAGVASVTRRVGLGSFKRALLAIGAALALLAMTGIGPHVDVFAHLFGLAVGGMLGALIGLARRPLGGLAQAALCVLSTGLVGVSWLFALR
jgi:membrane associated rhomboid family serine protease